MSITVDKIDINITSDYYGNVFLNHHDDVYYFMIDIDDGLTLHKIKNTKTYIDNCNNNKQVKDNIESGKILASKETLRGKTSSALKKMGLDEKEKLCETNEFIEYDEKYEEAKYFYVNYEKNEEEYFTEYEDDEYYLNLNGTIHFSNLLFFDKPNYNTIYIHDKCVKATIENKTGFCDKRITIYSNNKIRLYFVGDKDLWYKIDIHDNTIRLLDFEDL